MGTLEHRHKEVCGTDRVEDDGVFFDRPYQYRVVEVAEKGSKRAVMASVVADVVLGGTSNPAGYGPGGLEVDGKPNEHRVAFRWHHPALDPTLVVAYEVLREGKVINGVSRPGGAAGKDAAEGDGVAYTGDRTAPELHYVDKNPLVGQQVVYEVVAVYLGGLRTHSAQVKVAIAGRKKLVMGNGGGPSQAPMSNEGDLARPGISGNSHHESHAKRSDHHPSRHSGHSKHSKHSRHAGGRHAGKRESVAAHLLKEHNKYLAERTKSIYKHLPEITFLTISAVLMAIWACLGPPKGLRDFFSRREFFKND